MKTLRLAAVATIALLTVGCSGGGDSAPTTAASRMAGCVSIFSSISRG